MTPLEPDGFIVVPLSKDGTPAGVAYWCRTAGEAERVFNEELGRTGAFAPLLMYRSVESKVTEQ